MNIYELSDMISVNINLTYYANQNGRWCAKFENIDVKDGSVLIREHGNGTSPKAALSDYINKIKGKTLVINRFNLEKYREFTITVPDTLIL